MRRGALLLLVEIAAVAVVAAIIFDLPLVLEGFWRRESFFQGKPTTYWKHQLAGRGADFGVAQANFRKHGADGLPVLKEILRTGSEVERQNALAIMRDMGPIAKECLPDFHVMLLDTDPMFRVRAAEAIFKITRETDDVAPALVAALREDNDQICKEAALALGRMGAAAEAAVPALVMSLRDPAPRVRAWSAAALGELGAHAQSAAEDLQDACKDKDPSVAAAAAAALRRVHYRSLAPDS
jgi:HEAT repeat protein